MTTPTWQPGTLYPPGSLVRPLSSTEPAQSPPTNGNFEDGNTGWTLDSGFSIVQDGTAFDGTWALKFDMTAEQRAVNNNAVAIVPGQAITGSCQVQAGSSCGARAEIAWYDASDHLISYSSGNEVKYAGADWLQSTVNGVAPAGAAFARFVVTAFRVSGTRTPHIDQCVWNATEVTTISGLVFKAVQALAGSSGVNEPVWPLVNGQTVVDNEVTWEATTASRVVWEAAPILVSSTYEPNWPTVPNGTVADGTIKWVAMPARVTDPKCPNSKIGVAGASKIFMGDDDIIPFCATTNPLDWSSEQDAGYLPFGLNTYGSTPVEAMGLYRSNLVAFNNSGYQMWQIDEDPANMALLDASPVDCIYRKSIQAVMNDLAFLSSQGARNIGIAGASTNLQAGSFGKQIDPLVLAKIRAGLTPISLFFPGAGQYWLIFASDPDETEETSEAFVLTINSEKDQSWSRYIFPGRITDWAILDGVLYLRAGTKVWTFDSEALDDDIHELTSILCEGARWVDLLEHSPPDAFLNGGQWQFTASMNSSSRTIDWLNEEALPSSLSFYWSSATGVAGTYLRYRIDAGAFVSVQLLGLSGTVTIDLTGATDFRWGISGSTSGYTPPPTSTITIECSGGTVSTPFEGYIAWPYLDFGMFGLNKMLESVDVTATGEYAISVGYNQNDFSLATDPYTVDGDTLPGTPIPIPVAGPSFQLRLTFSASQAWEWMASNMYLSNMRIP